MDNTQKNLTYLSIKFPETYKRFMKQNYQLKPLGMIEELNYSKLFLYEKPLNFFKAQDLTKNNFIIAGLGGGYFCSFLKKQQLKKRLFIFENDIQSFKKSLEKLDLETLFQGQTIRLVFDLNPNNLEEHTDWLDIFLKENFTCIIEPGLKADITNKKKYLDSINNFLENRFQNFQLSYEQEYQLTKNTIANLPEIFKAASLYSLFKKFKDSPLILIAPGPSLEKKINILKNLQAKAIFLAVDTAVPVCIQNNIIPDIVVSVDQNDKNSRHLEAYQKELNSTLLICDPGVSPLITKHFSKNLVFYGTKKPLCQWLETQLGFLETITPLASVSYVAIQIAVKVTNGPIFLAGLDLCFSEKALYAKGAKKEGLTIEKVNGAWQKRIQTLKGFKLIPLYEIKTVNNSLAYTDALFSLTKQLIEKFSLKHHQNPFYSISEGVSFTNIRYIEEKELNKLFNKITASKPEILTLKKSFNPSLDNLIKPLLKQLEELKIKIKNFSLKDFEKFYRTPPANEIASFLQMLNLAQIFFDVNYQDKNAKEKLFTLSEKGIEVLAQSFNKLIK